MLKDNLILLRKKKQMTQEDVAASIGVTRQAVAKWESGETIPDLENSKLLADLFSISLDDMVNYDPDNSLGLEIPTSKRQAFFRTSHCRR